MQLTPLIVCGSAIISTASAFFNPTIQGGDSVQRIDPLLAPNTYNQHVHQVFGSNVGDPSTTSASLRKDTTCTMVVNPDGDNTFGPQEDASLY